MQLLLYASLNKLRFYTIRDYFHRRLLSHRVIEIWITKENK
jgi:hypothetical protein